MPTQSYYTKRSNRQAESMARYRRGNDAHDNETREEFSQRKRKEAVALDEDSELSDDDIVEEETPRRITTKPTKSRKNRITPSASTSKKSRSSESLAGHSSLSDEENHAPHSPSGSDSQRSTTKHRQSAGTSQQITELKQRHSEIIMAKSQETKRLEKENAEMKRRLDAVEQEKAAAVAKAKAQEVGKKALQIKHRSTLAKVGGTKSQDSLKNQAMVAQVKRTVKKKLWAHVKFIGNHKQLAAATLLCIDLMQLKDYLHKDGESEGEKELIDELVAEFQVLYSTDVRSGTNEQRSYVQGEMKKLYIAYRLSGGDPISYQEFKEIAMRNILDADGNPDPKKVAIFDLYLTMLSACAGSSTHGEKLRRTTPVSTAFASDGNFAVTCGAEAMTLVMFDNCVDKWDHMHQCKHVDNKPGKLPKYSPKKHDETKQWKTKCSDSCSGNSPYGGWSKEGIREFNKVTKEIQDLRENQADAILEVEKEAVKRFHAVCIVERKRKAQENGLTFDENEDGDGSPGSKRSKSDDDDEEVEAVFDMGNRAV